MTGVQQVRLSYKPRKPFPAFHARDKHKAVVVVHRRGGKTYAVIQDLIDKAQKFQVCGADGQILPWPKFAYLCPYSTQAKQVAWQYLVDFTRDIPGVKKN